MRILWVIPALQHPALRGPSRHYHLVREVARRHEVTLVTTARRPLPDGVLDDLGGYARLVLVDSPPARGGRAARMLERRRTVRRLRAAFLRVVSERAHDVVLFHGKPAFGVVDGFRKLPVAADFCDATSLRIRSRLETAPPAERPLLVAQLLRVRRVERRLLRLAPQHAFISARDREAVLGPRGRSPVVPNGIDFDHWTRSGAREPKPHRIAFSGVMDYAPNLQAALLLADEVLPRVRRTVPGAELVLVGRDPPAVLLERAARDPGVHVTGTVDDVRPHLEEATVFASPLRVASGMQNKLLEALALELPVVTTALAAAGLRGDDGAEPPLVVAEDADATAAAIVRLLEAPGERARLAAAGRAFVTARFDWAHSAAQLEALCHAALLGAAAPSAHRLIREAR